MDRDKNDESGEPAGAPRQGEIAKRPGDAESTSLEDEPEDQADNKPSNDHGTAFSG